MEARIIHTYKHTDFPSLHLDHARTEVALLLVQNLWTASSLYCFLELEKKHIKTAHMHQCKVVLR